MTSHCYQQGPCGKLNRLYLNLRKLISQNTLHIITKKNLIHKDKNNKRHRILAWNKHSMHVVVLNVDCWIQTFSHIKANCKIKANKCCKGLII